MKNFYISLFFCLFSLGTFSSEEPAKLRDIKEFTPEFNKVFVSLLILALVSILFTFFKWIIEKYWAKRKVKSSIKKLDLHDYLERMSNSSSKEDILFNLRAIVLLALEKRKKTSSSHLTDEELLSLAYREFPDLLVTLELFDKTLKGRFCKSYSLDSTDLLKLKASEFIDTITNKEKHKNGELSV